MPHIKKDDYTKIVAAMTGISRKAIEGLQTDGAHHKQYYLEEILRMLGHDLGVLREKYNTKPGIMP